MAIVIDKVQTTGHSASQRKNLKSVNITSASYPAIMPCTWQCRRNAPRQSFTAPPAIGHHESPYAARGSRRVQSFQVHHSFAVWTEHEFPAFRRATLPATSLVPEIAHTARRTAPVAETRGLLSRGLRDALQSQRPCSRDTSNDSAHTAAFSRTLPAETPHFAWSHQVVVAGAVTQLALSGPHQNWPTRKALAEKFACIGQSPLCRGGAFTPAYPPSPLNPVSELEAPPVSPGTTTATETDTIIRIRNCHNTEEN